MLSKVLPVFFGASRTFFLARGFGIRSISSSVGDPINVNINSIYYWVSFPGNKGLRRSSSANMQPADHTSIDDEYFLKDSKTSGARYHRVAT